MAKMNISLLVTSLALVMLTSYELQVCEGSRAFRAEAGPIGVGYVLDHSDKNRYLAEKEHVLIHTPVAFYGAEEANDTTPGHSPGAGHSTGPGAATPVISN